MVNKIILFNVLDDARYSYEKMRNKNHLCLFYSIILIGSD